MRREQYTVRIKDISWIDAGEDPHKPVIDIRFDGTANQLADRLPTEAGEGNFAAAIDVSLRLHDRPDAPTADGVISVTNRLTGDYILELNIDADEALRFVNAARRYGKQTDDIARYVVLFSADEREITTLEKRTFLVYGHQGELLRQYSLIPSGVEI